MASPIMHCPICREFVAHRITNGEQSDDESLDTMVECNICKFLYSTRHQQEYIELFQIVEEIWPLGREEYHLGLADFWFIFVRGRGSGGGGVCTTALQDSTLFATTEPIVTQLHTYSLRQMIVFIALYFQKRSTLTWKRYRVKQENQKKKLLCCIKEFPLEVCGKIASYVLEPLP